MGFFVYLVGGHRLPSHRIHPLPRSSPSSNVLRFSERRRLQLQSPPPMMRTIALFFACLCLILAGCSPHPSPSGDSTPFSSASTDSANLLPVKVAGKWGYINDKGQLVINPQFDYAQPFFEGRAVVCIGKPCDSFAKPGDSRYGYIGTTGKIIVTPQYQEASSFSEGLAAVCVGDGCGGNDKLAT